jgi:ACS family tartrate transporter-like MFS transporter
MQQELHFDDAVYGFGAGVFFAGYFLFQVPSNLALQRFGAKRWIALLMITWGVISACMALTHTPRSFYVLRFLLGSAEAGFFPGVILYLKTWFPAAARARTVARFMTASPLSGVVGGPISGLLLNMHGRTGLSGWQWLFLLEGIPAVLLGGVVLLYLTNRPEDATWLSGKQREWLLGTLRNEAEQVPTTASAFSTFSSGRVWMLCFVYFGLNTVSYGISMWLPNLIRSASGGSNLFIGVLSACRTLPWRSRWLSRLHSDKTGTQVASGDSGICRAIGLFAGTSSSTLSTGDQHRLGGRAVDGRTVLGNSTLAGRLRQLGLRSSIVWQSRRVFWASHHWICSTGDRGFAGGLLMVGGTLAVAGSWRWESI